MENLTSTYPKISEYIEAISEVIDFDIYIVDNKLLRVAGTGVYKRMLGIVLPQNTSNGWVLRNKKPLFMFNPLENEICKDCPMKKSDNCAKEYSIHMPIMLDSTCLGVITISSMYNDESKRRIVEEKDKLIKFIVVMVEVLTKIMKSDQKISNYERLLSASDEAIIITDKKGDIIEMSKVIEEKFENFHNVYQLITKSKASFGEDFQKNSFRINENLEVKRVKVDFGANNYNQIFFLNTGKKNKINEIDKFINNELFAGQIVGKSEILEEIKKVVLHVAKYDSNCLILGESGTGKEMFAKLIHNISNRRDSPFVPINCAAIPDHLIESEIFGYEAGAFTDASKSGKKGLFEVANYGTIFLDEIGDMPIYLQPKLLRVLETGRIKRIGGTKDIQLDVRFIAATNRNLSEQIKNGQFREDLYYRLCVIPLKLPPLRERTEDIIELTKYFIEKYNNKFGKKIKRISDRVKKDLLIYDWPGNVRELENVIEYAITMEKTDTLTTSSLPLNINYSSNINLERIEDISINDFKKQNITKLLEKYGSSVDSKSKIAKELGISLSTLYRYLKKYEI